MAKKDDHGKFKLNFIPGTQYGYSGQAYEYLKEVYRVNYLKKYRCGVAGRGLRAIATSSGISYGHSGSTNRGFISNLVFYEDSGLGFTVLTNSEMGGWLALPLLNEYLILGNPN